MADEEVIGEHDFPRPAPCNKCKSRHVGLSPYITSKGLAWKVVCSDCGMESKVKNDPLDAVLVWSKTGI